MTKILTILTKFDYPNDKKIKDIFSFQKSSEIFVLGNGCYLSIECTKKPLDAEILLPMYVQSVFKEWFVAKPKNQISELF